MLSLIVNGMDGGIVLKMTKNSNSISVTSDLMLLEYNNTSIIISRHSMPCMNHYVILLNFSYTTRSQGIIDENKIYLKTI